MAPKVVKRGELGRGWYWVEVDLDGEYTGNICSAWWGLSDKPMDGDWILVQHVPIVEDWDSE